MRPRTPIVQRFWEKVERVPFSTCWYWAGALNSYGYGILYSEGAAKQLQAHRFSYQLAGKTLGPDDVIDHTCTNHACVNPAHLEAVERGENVRRAQQTNLCSRCGGYREASQPWCRPCRRVWAKDRRERNATA